MKVDEVLRWLERAGEDLTLVGGQSVALWEHLLGLPVLTETVDIDFLGDAAQAQELADALGYDCRIPNSGDPTPNTAILVDDAGVVVADFLAFVAGLNETDVIRRRLPIVMESGHAFYVLHPFDCLASRLANIALIPTKRAPRGFDQLLVQSPRHLDGAFDVALLRGLVTAQEKQIDHLCAPREISPFCKDAGKALTYSRSHSSNRSKWKARASKSCMK